MKFIVYSIDWDAEDVELPTELTVEIADAISFSEEELVNAIGEEITNITGYCHHSFGFMEETEEEIECPQCGSTDVVYEIDGDICLAEQHRCKDCGNIF